MVGFVYKNFGFAHNDQILVSIFPVILDTNIKHWCGLSFQHKTMKLTYKIQSN